MTNTTERSPRLFITSDLLTQARDEQVHSITPHAASIRTVVERGSAGALRGLPVRQLILHGSDDVSQEGLRAYRILPGESPQDSLRINGVAEHPQGLIDRVLPDVHSLVVPVLDFDELTVALALHRAAGVYGQQLSAEGSEEQAPDKLTGVQGIDSAIRFGTLTLGSLISKAQPAEGREAPESLAEQLLQGIGPIISRGFEAVQAVQGLPADGPILPMSASEMQTLVEQTPPLAFTLDGPF
jgi:hypothetical protein